MVKFGYVVLAIVALNLWGCYGFIDVSLSTSTSTFLRGLPISVTFHVNNLNKEGSVFLLKWTIPFESDAGYQVLFNNGAVSYEGIAAYRQAPTMSDYVEIKAGETKSVKSDIWKSFDFTKVGSYHVRLDYFIQGFSVTPTGERLDFEPLTGLSNELMINIENNPDIPANYSIPRSFHGLAVYQCTSSQLDTIGKAWNTGKNVATSAYNSVSGGSAQYSKWFGASTSAREQRVKTVLGKLKSISAFKYSCGGSSCQPSYYGYVFPTDTTKTVYLCPQFWPSAVEQVRTLLHEGTHFNDVGATKDYAYGTSECMNLARSSPDKAIYNADNFCYYCY